MAKNNVSTAIDRFAENLPHRPYCSDDLLYGLRIRDVTVASLVRYIQHNQPHVSFWLVFDIDRVGGAIDWSDRNAPTPNLSVKNQRNGHAHVLYLLLLALRTAPDSSIKALRYAAAVERGLREKLAADVGYSGLICKNPLNDYWGVHEWRSEPYTLDELADYVDLNVSEARREAIDYGLGRNCTLFEKTRRWAYRAIRQGYPEFSQWLLAVIQRVEMYNVQLTTPLSMPECTAIGRSIAKWTYQRFTEKTFSQYVQATHTPEIQAARGRKNNTEVQAIKGSIGGKKANNWHEAGKIGGKKGGKISKGGGRPKGSIVTNSTEQNKPWEELGISRRWYYQQKKLGLL